MKPTKMSLRLRELIVAAQERLKMETFKTQLDNKNAIAETNARLEQFDIALLDAIDEVTPFLERK